MESGSLAEWYVAEGDSFGAGDAIAKIETDKASIDFEAQDDGFVAKILQETGQDLPVGAPILITVEEAEDVAAFKDYVSPKEAAAPPAAAEPAKAAPPPPPAPVAAAPAPVETPTPAPPVPEPVVAAAAAPVAAAPVAAQGAVASVAWGQGAATASPLAKTLAAAQKAYIEQYGSTGQRPIL